MLDFLHTFLTSERAVPWRAFSIALALRLLIVIIMRNMPIGLDDMFQYDMLARSILSGDGYRWYSQPDLYLLQSYFSTLNFQLPANYNPLGILTSHRAPFYPLFLAVIYFFTGINDTRFFVVRLLQAVLGAALAPLTYALAQRLFPARPHVARFAALTVACYPLLVIYPLALATENLFFILLLASVLTLASTTDQSSQSRFMLAGFLLGLTALTRSVITAFVGLAILWLFFMLKQRRGAILLALVFIITISPWVIRNSLLYGRITGIETSMGYNLYLGYHPQGTGTFAYGPSIDLFTILDDAERDRVGTQKALEFIKADPGRVLPLMVYRLGHFFGLERRALTYFYSNNFFGFIPQPLLIGISILIFGPYLIVILSSAPGLAILKWENPALLLPLVILGYTAPHIILLAEERFHYTLVPFFAILAALYWDMGFPALLATWKTSRPGKIAVTLAALTVCLLLLNFGYEFLRDADRLALLLGPNGNNTRFPY